MDELVGENHDVQRIDFQYVIDMFNKRGTANTPHQREMTESDSESFEILLYRSCSLATTDILLSLLSRLNNITITKGFATRPWNLSASRDFHQSTLLYDCLAIALENHHENVLRILLEFIAPTSEPTSESSSPSVLHCAAANGDVEIIKLLIESGVDVNQMNDIGEAALHYAYDAATAEMLLTNGADVNALTLTDSTPLYYACAAYRMGVMRKLLDNGADANLGETIMSPDNVCDWNDDQSIASVLLQFKANGDPQFQLRAKSSSSCILGIFDVELEDGYSMCCTCKNENQPLIDKLLARIVSIGVNNTNELPLLHSAVVDFYDKKVATGVMNMEPIELHLSTRNLVNALDKAGTTALYLAVERNLIEVATLLLNNGADPNLTTSNKYPLIVACRYLSHDFVRQLLTRDANPNCIDNNGRSPLIFAAESLDLCLVKLLVEHGANVNGRDRYGTSALGVMLEIDYARGCPSSRSTCVEIVKCLLENGSNVNLALGGNGETALALALDYISNADLRKKFSRNSLRYQLFEVLLENGADANGVSYGEGLLIRAIENECFYAARELLRYGAKPHASTHGSPLRCACSTTDGARYARILLAAGANINEIRASSLCYANIELIDLLLDSGLTFNMSPFDHSDSDSYDDDEIDSDDEEQSSRSPIVKVRGELTLDKFFAPSCAETEGLVQLFKAGSNLEFLENCCRSKVRYGRSDSCCELGGRLCQAIVLAGHNLQHQQLLEVLRGSKWRHNHDLASWLEEDSMTPPSLFRQSRAVVRRRLSATSGSRKITPLIDVLPISDPLQMYLRFEGPLCEVDLTVSGDNERCVCRQ